MYFTLFLLATFPILTTLPLTKPRMLLKLRGTSPMSPTRSLLLRSNLLTLDPSRKTPTPLPLLPVPSPSLLTSLLYSTLLPLTLVPPVQGFMSTNSTTVVLLLSSSTRLLWLSIPDSLPTLVTLLPPLLLLILCSRRLTESFPRACESVHLSRSRLLLV